MSCDVGPAGLATTRIAVELGPRCRAGSAALIGATADRPSAVELRDERSAATERIASASGMAIVAPEARACPPPPNTPVSTVASTPPARASGR